MDYTFIFILGRFLVFKIFRYFLVAETDNEPDTGMSHLRTNIIVAFGYEKIFTYTYFFNFLYRPCSMGNFTTYIIDKQFLCNITLLFYFLRFVTLAIQR